MGQSLVESGLVAKLPVQRTRWFGPGECQRLVLKALRDAVQLLSGRALARALVARKALESRSEFRALVSVNKTAMAVLQRLMSKGVVRRASR